MLPRHLYALYCLLQREINSSYGSSPTGTPDPNQTQAGRAGYIVDGSSNANGDTSLDLAKSSKTLPSIFTDHGWAILNTSIMSTSNCGNPALRLFGFGPVAADGYGIGYIIKDDGISVYVPFSFQNVHSAEGHIALHHPSTCKPDVTSTLSSNTSSTYSE